MIKILPFKRDYLPYHITLSMTNDCNLACPYCYVQKDTTYMSFEIGKQSIDFAYKNLSIVRNKYQDILPSISFGVDQVLKGTITFFGGEPLLNYQVLKQLVEYTENTYPDCFVYNITTNGILLNENICQFLKKYNFHITISCDGIKTDQDEQRPMRHSQKSSYDILEKNIALFKNHNLNKFMVRMTLTLKNLNHFYQDYLLFEQMGFSQFAFDLDYFGNWDENNLQVLYNEFQKIYQHRFMQYCNGILPPLEFLLSDDILERYIRGQLKILCGMPLEEDRADVFNNCGYGLEMICISGTGKFYPCHEEPDFFQGEYSNCIGNLVDGIDYEKLDKLRQTIKQVEETFLKNRICQKDCILKENYIPCYYISCPANLYQTKKVQTYNCIIRKYCLELILYYSNLLLTMNNLTFKERLNFIPDYQVYQDIMSQPKGVLRDQYINFYKSQIGVFHL